ncbi:MAG: stage III sporulation protein AF, partial [Clostridia bacterium]|nr:stage III sporulation protein AF [Clostridia bacterium]
MSEWLLGIVGIIALGLLLEIVLPDGQITKYVRGAFSLLVIVAVIAPLPKIFGGDFEFVFDGVSYEIDSAYLTSQGAVLTDAWKVHVGAHLDWIGR